MNRFLWPNLPAASAAGAESISPANRARTRRRRLASLAACGLAICLPVEIAAAAEPAPAPMKASGEVPRRLWNRLAWPGDPPINLANRSIQGCSIVSSHGIEHPEALISTDPSEDFGVPAGEGEIIIRLGGPRIVNNVDFINDHISAELSIATSPDNRNWEDVASVMIKQQKRLFEVQFPDVQCLYLRLSFKATHGGHLRGWDLYGPTGRDEFEFASSVKAGADAWDEDCNLAAAGVALPIYAFPSPTNDWLKGMLHHVFSFPRTNERYCTIIYDLGAAYALKEFSTAYTQRPVRVELFLLGDLQEKPDPKGRLQFDPEILERRKPDATFEDAEGHGHAKFHDFGSISARYVIFRYEPDYERKPATTRIVPRWESLIPVVGPAAALASSAVLMLDGKRSVAANDNTPFEHQDTCIIPVGGYLLMPAQAIPSPITEVQPDYRGMPYIGYVPSFPATLPGIPGPPGGRPPIVPPPIVHPHSP